MKTNNLASDPRYAIDLAVLRRKLEGWIAEQANDDKVPLQTRLGPEPIDSERA